MIMKVRSLLLRRSGSRIQEPDRSAERRIAADQKEEEAAEEARKQAAAQAAAQAAQSSSSSNSTSTTSSSSGTTSAATGNTGSSSVSSSSGSTASSESSSSGSSSSSSGSSVSYNSATGAAVVAYAMQFVGNPYVYGGNSLTNGIDCSGFTQQVFAHFGYSLPRTSDAQASAGVAVSWENHQSR